jgi:hypothetical protein
VGKFTKEETALIKNMVATLSIKRITDPEIMKEVYDKSKKTISRRALLMLDSESRRILIIGIRLCGMGSMNIFMNSKRE